MDISAGTDTKITLTKRLGGEIFYSEFSMNLMIDRATKLEQRLAETENRLKDAESVIKWVTNWVIREIERTHSYPNDVSDYKKAREYQVKHGGEQWMI